MKILMFGWEFPPHNSGGLGVACEGLVKELSKRNVLVTMVLPRLMRLSIPNVRFVFADFLEGEESARRVMVSPYASEKEFQKMRKLFPHGNLAHSLIAEVLRYALAAPDIAEKHPHDVIHVHDWLSIPAGIAAKQKSGKPLVVHIHATEYDRTGGLSRNPEIAAIEKWGLEAADRVIAVSEYTKKIIIREYGIPPEKISVVHNGLEVEDSDVADSVLKRFRERGGKVVLFLGRITLQKGPDYFLRIAEKVCRMRDDVLFVMAGSGDMFGRMVELSSELGIADKVLFTGFVRGEDVSTLYGSADIFILPSVSEPFGITPLEALHHGAPVIISKQSGVGEVVRHAIKADFWDVDAMADAVLCVLEYPELHHELSYNGGCEVGRLTWCESARKCLDIYSPLCATAV